MASLAPSAVSRRRFGVEFRYAALAPLVVLVVLFTAYPVYELVRLAFSTVTPVEGEFAREYTGLDNLRRALDDPVFGKALWHSVVFVLATTAIQITLGTVLALAIERARLFRRAARNVLLWPVVITPLAISATWLLILDVEFGLLNRMLDALGLPLQGWLASKTLALPALIIVDVWHWTPLVLLVVLAALATIDRSLYDAARVDGASEWHLIRHVTLPLLAPTLAAAALARAVLGFKVFDEIYLLTNGGPAQSTEMISTYVRRVFVDQVDLGYGAFLGLSVLVIFALALVLFGGWQLARSRRRAA